MTLAASKPSVISTKEGSRSFKFSCASYVSRLKARLWAPYAKNRARIFEPPNSPEFCAFAANTGMPSAQAQCSIGDVSMVIQRLTRRWHLPSPTSLSLIENVRYAHNRP